VAGAGWVTWLANRKTLTAEDAKDAEEIQNAMMGIGNLDQ
jgi:hypothetical protein